MFRKKGSLIICGILLFIAWNVFLIFVFLGRFPGYERGEFILEKKDSQNSNTVEKLLQIISAFENELESQNKILRQIQNYKSLREKLKINGTDLRSKLDFKSNLSNVWNAFKSSPVSIPILVMACNRVTVKRCLDKLLEYRPSPELFPIVVSQDCGHSQTADVIASYGSEVTHIKQPDLSEMSVPAGHNKFQGYYKISRHYHWALNQVFNSFSYSAVIVVEDDLEVAPDFFEYFKALHSVLKSDPTLWCVSAWNDNGRNGNVDPAGSSLLYRTDFFPGLGWMMLKELWIELEPKWPAAFWDDWMRHPDQRKDRSCIRPEISRTLTFGREGVSLGQFFDKYLRFIKLNTEFVPFTNKDMSYLEKRNYDSAFEKEVYSAPIVTVEALKTGKLSGPGPFRLEYSGAQSFKTLARDLGLMDDLKSGVPRAGYRGVVSFFSGGKRLFIAPPVGWTKYDPSWN